MIFASKTPDQIIRTPEDDALIAAGDFCAEEVYGVIPSKLHNEPNRILTAFREIDAGRGEYADWLRDFDERQPFWLRGSDGQPCRYPQYTEAEIDHAKRVLRRLAAAQASG